MLKCKMNTIVYCTKSKTKTSKANDRNAKEVPSWTPPTLAPRTPSPIFKVSTGGLMRKAQVEEFYVITWEAKKEHIFEAPSGGAAIMRQGPNLLKLARKEQFSLSQRSFLLNSKQMR